MKSFSVRSRFVNDKTRAAAASNAVALLHVTSMYNLYVRAFACSALHAIAEILQEREYRALKTYFIITHQFYH